MGALYTAPVDPSHPPAPASARCVVQGSTFNLSKRAARAHDMDSTACQRRLSCLSSHLLPPTPGADAAGAAAAGEKPKLAIICTVWYYLSHGQHEGDRFNHGYPMHGKWHDPEVELVSICARSVLYWDPVPLWLR